MKKILTAIGNSNLNDFLKENIYYQVLTDDLLNDDDVINFFEQNKSIDFLFIHTNVINNYQIKEFIDKINEINNHTYITLFKEKNEILDIFESDNLKILNDDNIRLDVVEEILSKEIIKYFHNYETKIISITGYSGVGKSTFSTFFAKNVENLDTKVLLIDFDIEDGNIKTILKLKNKKINDLNDGIINISKNFDVLCNLELKYNNEINYLQIKKMLDSLKEKYDLIIIDTSSKLENEYTKKVFYNSDEIYFLMEPNILGIKKANDIIEVFENDWKISKDKLKIILNKTSIYQINENIISEIFPDIDIIGRIKYSDKYNLMVNRNIFKDEINDEYKKLIKKIKLKI